MPRILLSTLFVFSATSGCGAPSHLEPGEFRIGLVGQGQSGESYHLRDAVFTIDGETSSVIDSEDIPDLATASASLAAGAYTVTLADGWRVERDAGNGTFEPMIAALSSPNPTNVLIDSLATTNLIYAFDVDGEGEITFEDGTLEVGVEFDDQPQLCGNGRVDPGEQCDGSELTTSCEDLGFSGGTLRCSSECIFDAGACRRCGDGSIDLGEECEIGNLDGFDCEDFGFAGGTLACSSECLFSTLGCSTCGDGVIDPGETCDPPGFTTIEACGPGCFRIINCSNSCQLDPEPCECGKVP